MEAAGPGSLACVGVGVGVSVGVLARVDMQGTTGIFSTNLKAEVSPGQSYLNVGYR